MNKQIKTSGIILRRINFAEADQIVTVLTEDYGKKALFCKGSRRLKSRHCGKLEPFNAVELEYYQGRDLGHLNEVESKVLMSDTALDLRAQSLLFYMAEATEKLVAEGQENAAIYQLLCETLQAFDTKHAEVIFYSYMIKLLTELGFMSAWGQGQHEGIDLKLTPSVIKWVSYMQKEDMQSLRRVAPSKGEKAEVFYVLKYVLGNILSKPFKSEFFLQSLV